MPTGSVARATCRTPTLTQFGATVRVVVDARGPVASVVFDLLFTLVHPVRIPAVWTATGGSLACLESTDRCLKRVGRLSCQRHVKTDPGAACR